MELERAIGRLEEGLSRMKDDVSDIKADMRTLLTWRWKIYGATAVVSLLASVLFELFMSLVVHAK